MANLNFPAISSGKLTEAGFRHLASQASPTEQVLGVLLATLIGVIGALLLVHWATADGIAYGSLIGSLLPEHWFRPQHEKWSARVIPIGCPERIDPDAMHRTRAAPICAHCAFVSHGRDGRYCAHPASPRSVVTGLSKLPCDWMRAGACGVDGKLFQRRCPTCDSLQMILRPDVVQAPCPDCADSGHPQLRERV